MIDLLRAAAGDLRTEIVRVAFSILSQSITIWTRSLEIARSLLPPRISWIRVSDKDGTQVRRLCCKLTTGQFHGNTCSG